MPGLVKRRFLETKGLRYDETRDTVRLLGGYRGVNPIVGVRKVVAEPGAVQLNDVLCFDEVEVREGCLVRGSLLAVNRVRFSLYGGRTAVVIGDVGTAVSGSEEKQGEVLVGWGEGASGRLFLHGNILARRVEVNAPLVMVGDIVAYESVTIRAPTVVIGRVVAGTDEQPGRVELSKATVFQAYARGDVVLGDAVSVMLPLIAAKNGSVKMSSRRVRVVSLPCIFCGACRNPLLCEHYLGGVCPLEEKGAGFDYLMDVDLQSAEGDGERYTFVSWYWRASPLMVVQNIMAKKILYAAARMSAAYRVDAEKRMVNGHPLDRLPDSVLEKLVEEARGSAAESAREARDILFSTIEEYFKSRSVDYVKCPQCGAPNISGSRICMYCGKPLPPASPGQT